MSRLAAARVSREISLTFTQGTGKVGRGYPPPKGMGPLQNDSWLLSLRTQFKNSLIAQSLLISLCCLFFFNYPPVKLTLPASTPDDKQKKQFYILSDPKSLSPKRLKLKELTPAVATATRKA